ncbi:MAG: RRXRR domain-containing protein, partial [Elusimicrobiota bacterium]|nr:RRXRR domain-containing protein [Elusimicrobiota bacterium]
MPTTLKRAFNLVKWRRVMAGIAFVLDRRKKPLMPTTLKRAWQLLKSRRARIHK